MLKENIHVKWGSDKLLFIISLQCFYVDLSILDFGEWGFIAYI